MLFIVATLGCHKEATPAEPLPEAPAYTLPSGKGEVAPCAKLDQGLWEKVGDPESVGVVVDLAGPVALPASFVVEARTELAVQGRLPGTELCALAGLEAVGRVREAYVARPKGP